MGRIVCGPASVVYEIGNDGLVRARWSGLVMQGNAGAISAMLLHAATQAGTQGVIGTLADCVLALRPVTATHYDHVPPHLRSMPVAIVVSAEQAWLYKDVATEAALSGTMRRAFLSFEQGEEWLARQVRARSANQVWWSARRSLP